MLLTFSAWMMKSSKRLTKGLANYQRAKRSKGSEKRIYKRNLLISKLEDKARKRGREKGLKKSSKMSMMK